jgi:hypothetical protein
LPRMQKKAGDLTGLHVAPLPAISINPTYLYIQGIGLALRCGGSTSFERKA